MDILIFLPYGGVSTHHFAIGLEIIQTHLDQGDVVTILSCDKEMNACSFNLKHDKIKCIRCCSIFKNGLEKLEGNYEVKNFQNLTEENYRNLAELQTEFNKIEDLRGYKVEDYDIGLSVLSSIISYTRNIDPINHKQEIHNLLVASYKVYYSTLNHLKANKYSKVYIFNGRRCEFKAVFKAAEKLGIDCYIYEYGSDLSKYMTYKNHLPHSIAKVEELINETWENEKNISRRNELAKDFFTKRKEGIVKQWYSFTNKQKKDLLPDNWDSRKNNIVIFNSSEDEFVAIGDEWKNTLYKSQAEGIKKIISSISPIEKKDFHIYLRMHPNLKGSIIQENQDFYKMENDYFTVIPPESDISSYLLLDEGDKIVTFGSTMGIEAVYWGKPSVLVGKSFYMNLGSTYNPSSHEDVVEFILSKNLHPLSYEGALRYGFFFNTCGVSYKYVKMKDYVSLNSFKNQKLKVSLVDKGKIFLIYKYRGIKHRLMHLRRS
jgi:hypothetical protein